MDLHSAVRLYPRRRTHSSAFTLVEILIVVVILGILASIVVPKLSNASQTARENTLHDDIRFLRTQFTVYGAQHHDVFPGYPGGDTTQTPTGPTLVAQMTLYTDERGNTSATGSTTYSYGPYLSQMPMNPVNYLTTIKVVSGTGPMIPDGTTGWLYQPLSGAILPNITGSDSTNNAYTTY